MDIVTRHAGQAAKNLVTTYFALGDADYLGQLLADAKLTVAVTKPVGESRFGSVDELVTIEIDSTPLGDRLDPTARERTLADCRDALAIWQMPDGSLLFPFECNLIVGRPG